VAASYVSALVRNGPQPAQLSGSVNGSSMTLSIVIEQVTLGPFDLQSGTSGTIPACNF
jgi:hypothetical protein